MQRLIWAVTALQLCAIPVFAQSTPPTTPSSPPVTTPPPAAAPPPTGGPNSLPTAEPPNIIANGSRSQGGSALTQAQAERRLQEHGFRRISAMTRDRDGSWHGIAAKNGARVRVSVDDQGQISSNRM